MACSRVLPQLTVDVGQLCLVRSCGKLQSAGCIPLYMPHWTQCCVCTTLTYDMYMYWHQYVYHTHVCCLHRINITSFAWMVATVVAKHTLPNHLGWWLSLQLHGSYACRSEHVCPMPHRWNMEPVHVCTQQQLQALASTALQHFCSA